MKKKGHGLRTVLKGKYHSAGNFQALLSTLSSPVESLQRENATQARYTAMKLAVISR